MRNLVSRAARLLAVLLLTALPASGRESSPSGANAGVPAGVAVMVNGRAIPQRILDSFLKNGQEALGIDPRTEEGQRTLTRFRQAILDEQIEHALIVQEAETRGIAPDAAQIDSAEERVRTLHGDEASYEHFLRENGFTRDEYREFVLRTDACASVLQQTMAKGLVVSEDEVKAHYEAHRAEASFQIPERVAASHILINAQPGVLSARLQHDRKLSPGPELQAAITEETERCRVLAEEVHRQAASPGADFAALAKQYSDDYGTRNVGGSLGAFVRGTHPLALDDVLFALKPDEIGPVVRTEYGFHVVKVTAHQPARTKTLAEASADVRRQLLTIKQANQFRDWLKTARAKATVLPRDPATS